MQTGRGQTPITTGQGIRRGLLPGSQFGTYITTVAPNAGTRAIQREEVVARITRRGWGGCRRREVSAAWASTVGAAPHRLALARERLPGMGVVDVQVVGEPERCGLVLGGDAGGEVGDPAGLVEDQDHQGKHADDADQRSEERRVGK